MARDGRQLTAEDRILWSRVARTVKALPGRMDDLASSADVTQDGQRQSERAEKPKKQPVSIADSNKTAESKKTAPGTPGQSPIDGSVYRKLARGRVPLEASIDLHGMTQSEAYGLLHGFLARAHRKGMRHVLVITGKGASFGSDGVLRRAVPQWLRGAEFRGIASGCSPAARGHGGDGALYVRLRRRAP